MKYCVDYKKDFRYLDQVDELTVHFRRKDTSLVDFLLLHQKQRVNICIDDEEDFIDNDSIKLFDAIRIEHPEIDFSLKLKDYKNEKVKEIVNIIKASAVKHKFFFATFVKDWDTLFGYMELCPSDMYIVENLGFELSSVADILHAVDIRVRVFPNIAQSSWSGTEALKKFFIRPEDVYFYEPCVDVMEFIGKEDSISTYYKIYAIDKKWFGKLNEIIIDFNDNEIDSRFILPQFAARRLNCGKRCFKGRPCRTCNAIKELATLLESKNLMIKDFEK